MIDAALAEVIVDALVAQAREAESWKAKVTALSETYIAAQEAPASFSAVTEVELELRRAYEVVAGERDRYARQLAATKRAVGDLAARIRVREDTARLLPFVEAVERAMAGTP